MKIVTIHSDDPFATPAQDKTIARRWRGRLAQTVSIVAAGPAGDRAGLTVASLTVVEGPEDRVVIWIDPDSDLADKLLPGEPVAISVLQKEDRYLADAFAGVAPAPGGPFRIGDWQDSLHGPILADRAHALGRIEEVRSVGWSTQCIILIEVFELNDGEPLTHYRGEYR